MVLVPHICEKFDQIKLYQNTSQAVQRGQILIGKCWKLDDCLQKLYRKSIFQLSRHFVATDFLPMIQASIRPQMNFPLRPFIIRVWRSCIAWCCIGRHARFYTAQCGSCFSGYQGSTLMALSVYNRPGLLPRSTPYTLCGA